MFDKLFAAVPRTPSWQLSAVPVVALLAFFGFIIVTCGPGPIAELSPWALLGASALAMAVGVMGHAVTRRGMRVGFVRSARQIMPAVPMLVCIGALASTWMLSGIVPTLVSYGVAAISPRWFLVTACVVCASVSLLTGSSWSTIATVGVAFVGIGQALGYSAGWTAGAIISGAYFGDKMSPLSDTTVLAASACGVPLFTHIRFMTRTTVPAMIVTLAVYALCGHEGGAEAATSHEITEGLAEMFDITPWTLVVPTLTFALIAMRVNTVLTLTLSAAMGLVAAVVLQPQIAGSWTELLRMTWSGVDLTCGVGTVDELVGTGGVLGIMPVVFLVLAAMLFGTVMIGTGMLATLTHHLTRRLARPLSTVATTLATGLTLNAATADQYLSIIIAGNIFRGKYAAQGLPPKLLSRTLEDGITATSPIIPWTSCGVTQSTVLGVSVAAYAPYSLFNWLTPIVSFLTVALVYRLRKR